MFKKIDIIGHYCESVENFIDKCVHCGICIDECHCISVSFLENIDQERIIEETKDALMGGAFTKNVVERAFACTRCGVCADVCPEEINVYDLQQALRWKILGKERFKLSPVSVEGNNRALNAWDIDDMLASLQVKPTDQRWKDSASFNTFAGDTLLFIGCHARRHVSTIDTLLDILEKLDIKLTVIAGGKVCCGARFSGDGMYVEAENAGIQLVTYLEKLKPKNVYVQCPSCFLNIQKTLEKRGDVPFKLGHVNELISTKLKDASFSYAFQKNVVFCDPCKFNDLTNQMEVPRKILQAIPKLRFRMISSEGNYPFCCGGPTWNCNPAVAEGLRKKSMDCVEAMGAEIMVTDCLFCYQSFSGNIQNYSYDIMGLTEIIGEALGIKHENKLHKYFAYCNPERVLSETAEYIKASQYTIEEMRNILNALMS